MLTPAQLALKKAGIPVEINNSKNPKLMHVYMVNDMTDFFKKHMN